MKNLQALRSAEDMLKVLSVAHDMFKEERESNNKLRVEAKKVNDDNEEENFYLHCPWRAMESEHSKGEEEEL